MDLGGRPFHARSILDWVLSRGVTDFERMTDLPAGLRARLAGTLEVLGSRVAADFQGGHGVHRQALALPDGETAELVVMRGENGRTVCVSSQVGCPVGCSFCASGVLGLARNLETWEILEQFLRARQLSPFNRVVFMGTGDPALNADHVIRAIHILTDPGHGFGVPPRRITLSTATGPSRIRGLARVDRPVGLAISLHAADDRLRAELVPSQAGVSIDELMAAALDYRDRTGGALTVEYVLLADVNDDAAAARSLAARIGDRPFFINLIPYNPVEGMPYRRPRAETTHSFRIALEQAGLRVRVRQSRGRDVDAACGQLRRTLRETAPGKP